MVFPFLTVYLTTILGYSLSLAGYMAGAFGAGGLLGSYLGGKLSDQIGPRAVIGSTLTINGIILMYMPFAVSFQFLFFMIFLMGLFGEAYRPAVMSSVGNFVPASQTGRSMSLLRLAISLGMSLAPLLGGFIAVAYGYLWLFWVDGFTCILAGAYLFYSSRKWDKPLTRKPAQNTDDLSSRSKPPYRDRNFIYFLFATLLMGLAFIQWFHTVPVFIKEKWGFDERYIGIMMGAHSMIVSLFELPVIDTIEKKAKIKISVMMGLLITSFSFIPFIFPGNIMLYILAMILFTIGGILYLPFNNAIPVKMSPVDRRGEYMAWYWMIWSVTNIAGPVIGFSFAEQFGFSAFWIFTSLMAVASLLINKFQAGKIII
jgi:MFS family permease